LISIIHFRKVNTQTDSGGLSTGSNVTFDGAIS